MQGEWGKKPMGETYQRGKEKDLLGGFQVSRRVKIVGRLNAEATWERSDQKPHEMSWWGRSRTNVWERKQKKLGTGKTIFRGTRGV